MTLKKVERLTLRTAVRTRDETFPGSWLYPADQRIEGLPPCLVADTVYVIHTKWVGEGMPNVPFLMQMLSTGPDGLRYGWDLCGGCGPITRCTCLGGLIPPQWVRKSLQPEQSTGEVLYELDPALRRRLLERITPVTADPVPTSVAELDKAAEETAGGALSKLKKKLLG